MLEKSLLYHCLRRSYASLHCKWRLPLNYEKVTSHLMNGGLLSSNDCVSKRFNTVPFHLLPSAYIARSSFKSCCPMINYNVYYKSSIKFNDFRMRITNMNLIESDLVNIISTNTQPRHFSTCSIHLKVQPDSSIGWKIDQNRKIFDTNHKFKDAKMNLIEDLQETKSRMKEKIDEIVERENILTIPNLLCISRLVAAPFLWHLIVSGNYHHALALFLLAGVTDLADGWIARTFPSQASKLGSFLDPLADKVLVAVVFLSLTYNGLIPLPLTGLIIYRDVLIIGAASWVRYKSLPAPRTVLRYFDATHATVELSPTPLSKANTAVQLGLITAALVQPVLGVPGHTGMTVLWFVTTCTTLSSGLGYIFSPNTYKVLGDVEDGPTLHGNYPKTEAKDDLQYGRATEPHPGLSNDDINKKS